MSNSPSDPQPAKRLSRRDFIRASAGAAAATWVAGCAAPDRRTGPGILAGRTPGPIRVGVIGCGGRGTGAAIDCINAADDVQIVALADLFQDRLDGCREALAKYEKPSQIRDDRCFVGFDAYKELLACDDVNLVILAAPPGFRPPHLEASVAAGKHIFTEKPVGVDPVGIRRVIAASDRAAANGLAIVAGTQRRHQQSYLEAIKRIHDGMIGEIVAAECYWNQGGLWVREREEGWTDMEHQCRNWLYYDWLSGDHIVEQHVHNLDVINWAMGGPPVRCVGMGGRQARTEEKYGNIYDHFCVEYEYANGARVLSMCRQIDGTSERVSERLVGTRGHARLDGNHNAEITRGRKVWKYEGPTPNMYVVEHTNLIRSIRAGRPLNEGRRVAISTLTAIMGRVSAYTGREVSWNWLMNSSQLDLSPGKYEFGDLAIRPVPIPGQTKLA